MKDSEIVVGIVSGMAGGRKALSDENIRRCEVFLARQDNEKRASGADMASLITAGFYPVKGPVTAPAMAPGMVSQTSRRQSEDEARQRVVDTLVAGARRSNEERQHNIARCEAYLRKAAKLAASPAPAPRPKPPAAKKTTVKAPAPTPAPRPRPGPARWVKAVNGRLVDADPPPTRRSWCGFL